MDSSFAEHVGVRSIPLKGLNERIVPELIELGNLSKLIGLRQNKLGQLVRYPGEDRLNLDPLSSVRGLFLTGEYILIQTETVLLRARLNELFSNFPQVTPELFPDSYAPPGPTPPPINEELMSYALINYELSSGTPAGATVASTWNTVPLNSEKSDSDNRVSVAAGVVTITAGSYPAFVRVTAQCAVTGPTQGLSGANANQRAILRFKNNSTLAVVAQGIAMRETTGGGTAETKPVGTCHLEGRFQIAASTDFKLECFTSEATTFGREMSQGAEVYAQLKVLIEE